MLRRTLAVCLFVCIFLCLAWTAGQSGLASGYIDSTARIAPQDEAVYSHIALRMAERGDWLTPHFLNRYALFKPPLLYWASALSVKMLGDTVLALRLPSLVVGALLPALLCLLIPGGRGLVAAVLLASHPLWWTLARLNLTDALLALWIALAAVSLWKDSRAGFAAATAAAILTKGIAGLTPLFVWAGWVLLSKASFRRWLPALGASLALAAPWFLYQLAVHPGWFWTEFVQVEILGYSLGAPPQTTQESQIMFYARRLILADPLLCLLLLCAFPALWRLRREPKSALLLSWIAVVLALALANGYRNVAYLLPAIPAICWAAAEFAPWRPGLTDWALAAVIVCLAVPVLGFPLRPNPPVPAAASLERYAALRRPNGLVIVEVEDQFVATTLQLPRIRYAFRQPEENYRRYGLDFRKLGIVLTVDEFLDRENRQWTLETPDAVGTVILANSDQEMRRLLDGSPSADFVIPARLRTAAGSNHELREMAPGLVFLLAR